MGSTSASPAARRDELDVLRGMLLVMMAITHLPTRLNVYSSQPFGFVSAAEGFVFLSAFLVGAIYSRQLIERGALYVRTRLWQRAGRLYLAHLALLLFLFTVVAGLAVATGRPALRNHLSVYFASPVRAAVAGPLLLYQPPLLDILPMYIAFLVATPMLLGVAARRGWRLALACSALLWLFAQLGGRTLLYGAMSQWIGLRLPLDAFGAFDWFAWQLVWVAGLWLGSRQSRSVSRASARAIVPSASAARLARSALLALAGAATLGFLLWRYHVVGPAADAGAFRGLTDKWHLGGLRVLNFAALAYVVSRVVLPALAWLRIRVLSMLGRASLAVFTTHVPFCVLSRALIVDETSPLPLAQEALVVIVTFGAMLFVAWWAGAARAPLVRAAVPA